MTTRRERCLLIAVAALLLLAAAAWSAETRLAGIKMESTPKDVLKVYGSPDGMLVRQAGGVIGYVGMSPLGLGNVMVNQPAIGPGGNVPIPSGLGPLPNPMGVGPETGTGMPSTGGTSAVALPSWAEPVKVEALGTAQVEWLYRIKSADPTTPLALGVVITGDGPDAIVTDVIVASFKDDQAAKQIAATAKGVRLGDTFASVVKKYNFPLKVQVFDDTPSQSATGTGAPSAEVPGGVIPPSSPVGYPGAPVMGEAGMMPGAVTPGVGTFGRSLLTSFDDTAKLFTKACIAYYGSVSFTFSRMKVARIHIFE